MSPIKKSHIDQAQIASSLSMLVFLLLSITLIGCGQPPQMLKGQVIHRFSEVPVIDAELANDGSLSLLIDINQQLSLWQNDSQQLLQSWTASRFVQPQYHVALSGDKTLVASAGKTWLTLFSASSGETLAAWQVNGFDPAATISQVLLDHRGKRVVIGLTEGSVIIADVEHESRSLFKIHEGVINHLIFNEAEQTIMSGAHDGMVNLWQIDSGETLWHFPQKYRVTALALDQNTKQVFVSDALNNQRLTKIVQHPSSFALLDDASADSNKIKLDYFERFRTFRKAIFTDNGQKLLTSTAKYQIHLWNSSTGTEIAQGEILSYTMGSTVLDFAWYKTNQLYSLSSDGVLEQWHIP